MNNHSSYNSYTSHNSEISPISIRQRVREIADESQFIPNFSHDRIPLVFAISGGKGGIGKTLTTANLGVAFSEMGLKTLLIDADMGLANLDVVLNLRTHSTLDEVLNGTKQLRDVIHTGPQGVRVIPSASGLLKVNELEKIHKLSLIDSIENLTEEFSVMIIDTPAGVSKNVQYWTSSAAEIILVVTPEPTSIADCYATMKILAAQNSENRFKLIINMVKHEEEAYRVFAKLSAVSEEYLSVRLEYLGFIVNDESVRLSVRERVPFVTRYPFSQAANNVRQIIQNIHQGRRSEITSKGTMQFFWKRMIGHCLD